MVAALWAGLCSVFWCTRWRRDSGWSAHRINDPLKTMAHVVNRASKHRTDNLKENEAGTGIDIGLRPVLKCDQQHGKLQSAKQQRAGAQNAQVARSLHEDP
jgi:hypothetical protein